MNFKKIFRRSIYLALVIIPATVASAQRLDPSAERLRETVTYLASDTLEGRRTGTPGANDAAQYIADQFQRLGLKPGLPLASGKRPQSDLLAGYEQKFPYVASVSLGDNNLLFIMPRRAEDAAQFMVDKDWLPLGFSANAAGNA